MSRYLSAADLIVAKLNSQLRLPTANIRHAVSLDWAVKNALSPSVSVIFFDDVPLATPSSRHGNRQVSDQYWLLLITVRNVSDVGIQAIQEAGVLVEAVLNTLQGVELSLHHQPLVRQKCPYRKTDQNGFVFFPLMFSTWIVT